LLNIIWSIKIVNYLFVWCCLTPLSTIFQLYGVGQFYAYHHWYCEFKSRCVQHYVIKFVTDLRQVVGFLRVLRFPPLIKLTNTICQIWNEAESRFKQNSCVSSRFAEHLDITENIQLVVLKFMMETSLKSVETLEYL
jgi:hypothetical protein